MRALLLTIFFAISFCAMMCKQATEPPPSQPPENTDTTSHNFTIVRIDSLGDTFSSVNAIDIVDDNDVWVVGEFTKGTDDVNSRTDSNYNAAHWDGARWNMIRIPIKGFGGPTDILPQSLVGIKVFSDSSIFVYSNANSYAKWDGVKWYSSTVNAGPSTWFWSRSENEIYLVGSYGTAVRYNGTTFTKMFTGITNPPLVDIWGTENDLYAVGFAFNDQQGGETVFLHYDGQIWSIANRYNIVDQSPPPPNQYVGDMASVFQKNTQSTLWLLGGGDGWIVYKITSLAPFHAEPFYKIGYGFYPSLIRGNGDNDLFVASGLNGQFLHFNGSSWAQITPPITARTGPLCIRGNLCVVGGQSTRLIVVICKR